MDFLEDLGIALLCIVQAAFMLALGALATLVLYTFLRAAWGLVQMETGW